MEVKYIDKPIEPNFVQAKVIEAVCPEGTHPGLVLPDGVLTVERNHHAGYLFTTTVKNESSPASYKNGNVEPCYKDHSSD